MSTGRGAYTVSWERLQNPCINPYVRIVRATPVYFETLQAAYDAAADGETIQAQAMTFVENLDVNRNITVRLDGGYNGDFTAVTGETVVKGQVHTSNGVITITNLRTQK